MRISDILSTKGVEVVVIGRDASVRDLVALLRSRNLGAVVVSEDGRTVEGIVSERDVVRRLADGAEVLDRRVADLMTTPVRSCHARDDVDALMALMTDHRIRHVPVVDDDGLLAGIVSIGDVVKSRITDLQFERDQLQEYVLGH